MEKKLFMVYEIEGGGLGYKPAKRVLNEGTRICLDKEKMLFGRVLKVVESTAEKMSYAWRAAKGQNRLIKTSGYFRMVFLNIVNDICL